MDIIKFKNDIYEALKNKYTIEIHYSNCINFKEKTINWKYPPYKIKSTNLEYIVDEIQTYFKNFLDFVIIMHIFYKNNLVNKIPLNIPI